MLPSFSGRKAAHEKLQDQLSAFYEPSCTRRKKDECMHNNGVSCKFSVYNYYNTANYQTG